MADHANNPGAGDSVAARASYEKKLDESIKWSKIVYEQNKKIKRRLNILVVGGFLKLAIVTVPIILALIFLPPLLKDAQKKYKFLFDAGAGSGSAIESLLRDPNIKSLLK